MLAPEFLNVLCVDDQASMRSIVRTMLRGWGIRQVKEAGDGLEALKILTKEDISVIITDWNMPKVNGMKLFKAVTKNPTLNKIPVIMLTGHVSDDAVRLAISNGVRFFLSKPVQPAKLYSRLEAAVGPIGKPTLDIEYE
jgi:two-component system, chemotaxis family, chemotaxis protein CheY